MRLSTALTLTLVALLLVFPVGVIGASSAFATSSAPAAADSQSRVHAQSQQVPTPDDPQQVITIRLTADGNAEWTVESRYLLEDEDEIETFRTFADAVIAGERDIDYDRETFEHFRWSAQNSVDRQMELRNASWDEPRVDNRSEIALETDSETDTNTDIDDDTRIGIISYSFTWTNFTEKDGNRIYLGNVFEQDGSTWFPRLVDGQRLVIVSPSNYGYEQVARAPTDGKLVWDGPYEFDEGELSVTYLEGAPVETETPEEESPIPSRTTLGFGLFVLFVIVGAGGFFISSRSSSDTDGADGIGGAEAKATDPSADGASETEMETANGAATTGTAAVTGTETTTTYDETDGNPDVDNDEDDVDLELLSDEERVHRLLRQNGGRMKQASIVKETGWSNAKVSQLLSKMDDDEEIEKLRIGRENLITHPEVDPTEID